MSRLTFLLIILGVLSCQNDNQIFNTFICKHGEYWKYYDDCRGGGGLYFKFYDNGTYDKFMIKPFKEGAGFDLFNNDGDLKSEGRSWNVKNDSILIWSNEDYHLESYSKELIVFSYSHKISKSGKCRVFFKKIVNKHY